MNAPSLLLACVVVSLVSACSPQTVHQHDEKPSIVTIAGQNGDEGGFADGTGTDARFDFPEGLALDSTGQHLYIADSVNHVIRQLEISSGVVTTLAGAPREPGFADSGADGGVRMKLPRSLALTPDETGLYFTDTGNSVIRHLDLTTLEVTTRFGVARSPGTDDGRGVNARFGRTGLFGPLPWGGQLIIDANVLYVADSANQTVRAIDLRTGDVTTIAGRAGVLGAADGPALEATFNKPSGLGLQGRALYISEANSLTIRKLDLDTKLVSTVAGKAPADPGHYCENVSPVLPPECGSTDSSQGLEARFRFPFGMASDGRGGFFVVDSHNNLIRSFDPTTTAVGTVAGEQETVLHDLPHPSVDSAEGQPGTFSHPAHVVFFPPRTLFVADRSANCIKRVELKP